MRRAIVRAKGLKASSDLMRLADDEDYTALQHDRIVALSLLIGTGELEFWPDLVGEKAR